jgi:hypothetical protein
MRTILSTRVAICRETKLTYAIYIYIVRNKMLKVNIGSRADKYVDVIDNVMLPHSWMKLTNAPLVILYVVVRT